MTRIAMPEQYRECAARGLTRVETAAALGVAKSTVQAAAVRYNITFTRPPYVNHAENPVVYRGTAYPSQTALARALGVSSPTVCKYLNEGRIDDLEPKDRTR